MREHECYRILKVPSSASFAEVQRSYRRLVKLYHPDLSGRQRDGKQLSLIVEAFRAIQDTRADQAVKTVPIRQSGSGSGATLTDLGRLVTTGRSASTRAFAVMRLANTGRRSAYSWVRRGLFDSSRVVVEAAVDAVGRLGILQAGGELALVFARGDSALRFRILDVVSRMSDLRPYRSVIVSGMQDPDPDVRRMGLRMFRYLKQFDAASYEERKSG